MSNTPQAPDITSPTPLTHEALLLNREAIISRPAHLPRSSLPPALPPMRPPPTGPLPPLPSVSGRARGSAPRSGFGVPVPAHPPSAQQVEANDHLSSPEPFLHRLPWLRDLSPELRELGNELNALRGFLPPGEGEPSQRSHQQPREGEPSQPNRHQQLDTRDRYSQLDDFVRTMRERNHERDPPPPYSAAPRPPPTAALAPIALPSDIEMGDAVLRMSRMARGVAAARTRQRELETQVARMHAQVARQAEELRRMARSVERAEEGRREAEEGRREAEECRRSLQELCEAERLRAAHYRRRLFRSTWQAENAAQSSGDESELSETLGLQQSVEGVQTSLAELNVSQDSLSDDSDHGL